MSGINAHLKEIRGESPDLTGVIEAAKELTPRDLGWVAIGCTGAFVGLAVDGVAKAYHATAEFMQQARDLNRAHQNPTESESTFKQ